MASVKGVNKTLVDAGTKLDLGVHGKLKVRYDTYEATGEAIGSDITITKGFKKGEVFYGGKMVWDALGASSTLIIGDVDDDNRFLVSTSTSSAGSVGLDAIAGFGYEFTEDKDLIITTAGGTITGTIKVAVYYTD